MTPAAPDATSDRGPVVLDVAGRRVELTCSEALLLRDAAASQAGRSSRARDLSLLLERALTGPNLLALTRGELRALARVAEAAERGELAMRLRSASR